MLTNLGSIHPQGWVPIETLVDGWQGLELRFVAFTPKGGCPLKLEQIFCDLFVLDIVAFTPKGGCPLKHACQNYHHIGVTLPVAFTPKGGCPLKQSASN